MSKRNNIRWRKKDYKEIATVARVFNSKLTRILKAHPEWEGYMPERISTEELKSRIKTRADFNRELNSFRRFMKKGAEMPLLTKHGIKTTQWEKKEVGYKVAQINRNRKREAKQANVSTEKGTMGSIEGNNLKPKSYKIDNIRAREWEMYKKTVDHQVKSTYKSEKIQKYKENYLRAIVENLGEFDVAQELYDYVQQLDPALMYNAYYDDPILQIQFTSDPLPAEMIAENALEHWKRLAEK